MRQRIQTGSVLFVIFITVVLTGDILYWGAVLAALSLAGWEWGRLFGERGLAGLPVLGFVWAVMLDLRWPEYALLRPGVALVLTLAMAQMVIGAHRGAHQPTTRFHVELSGGLYLGWMGMHLVLLRALPDGLYWTLTVLPTVFAADTAAYLVGRQIGKHKLAPRISPKKTWEGYLAGIVGAVMAGGLLGALWQSARFGAQTTPAHGAAIGLLCGTLCVFGDLGISAFKRQMKVKDSSHLLPGHGGLLDRLDTVLWASVIGYYYVLWFVA